MGKLVPLALALALAGCAAAPPPAPAPVVVEVSLAPMPAPEPTTDVEDDGAGPEGETEPAEAGASAGMLGVLGSDPQSRHSGLFAADEGGLSFGTGGFGLQGVGPGAGGVGGLGTLGTGSSGSAGALARPKPIGKVGAGSPVAQGALPKEIIQRVMRQNLGRIRYCYEKALAVDPTLEGRLTAKLVIGANGEVTAAAVDADGPALKSSTAPACVRTALQALAFPAPDGGGIVVVSYPFDLRVAP